MVSWLCKAKPYGSLGNEGEGHYPFASLSKQKGEEVTFPDYSTTLSRKAHIYQPRHLAVPMPLPMFMIVRKEGGKKTFKKPKSFLLKPVSSRTLQFPTASWEMLSYCSASNSAPVTGLASRPFIPILRSFTSNRHPEQHLHC